MAKDSNKKEKVLLKEAALDVYQKGGCTLPSLKMAIQYGIDNKEKDLTKTFKRQLFQAAGLDCYRIRCKNKDELNAMLRLSLAVVGKNDNPIEWLDILEQHDYWNASKIENIIDLLNKSAAKLATHIPKARNPDNDGAPRFNKIHCDDSSVITSSEASLAIATISDAALVSARFFFEFVFYVEGNPSSVIKLLLDKDAELVNFLHHSGISDSVANQWQKIVSQSPQHIPSLHAQLLLKNVDNEWLSVTPIIGVSVSSWLGYWRKEMLFVDDNELSNDGVRPLFSIESVEYGGSNARNIASILMDFAGRQQHPKVLPPPVNKGGYDRLVRLIHYPSSLINPRPLYGKVLSALSNPYNELPNQHLTQKLSSVINILLDDCLENITLIRSLLDGESEEATAFQNVFNSISATHDYLSFVCGEASDSQIKKIGSDISNKWLGSVSEFKPGSDRYIKIEKLIIEQLQEYIKTESAL